MTEIDYIKVPPNAQEAEVSVLGAMMLDKEAAGKVLHFLDPTVFYKGQHQAIFDAMAVLFREGKPIDQISVIDQLKSDKMLDKVGGAYYVTGLAEGTPSAANVEHYAKIVLEKAVYRQMIEGFVELIGDAYEGHEDPMDIIEKAEGVVQRLTDMRGLGGRRDFRIFADVLEDVISYTADIMDKKRQPGIMSGYRDFDRRTGGFKPGHLYIIAGRPGHGKTAFMLGSAAHLAEKGHRCGLFSLETTDTGLGIRLLAGRARVDTNIYNTGKISQEIINRLLQTATRIRNLPIFIDDSFNMRILDILARTNRMRKIHRIEIGFYDHLQLMYGDSKESRNQDLTVISRQLKVYANKYNIPVVALSQLSRKVEERPPAKQMPILSDLRESGAIEQDADVVLFLWRPEMSKLEKLKDGTSSKNIALANLAKQRDGVTDEFKLTFLPEYVAFENYESENGPAMPRQGSATQDKEDTDDEIPF